MKKCSHCQIQKDFSEFTKCKARKDGLYVYCKSCFSKKQKEWRKRNPLMWERQRARNFLKWRKKLGIDPDIQLKRRNGSGYITAWGYLTYKRKGHPCADKNGRAQASHLVMYECIGRALLKGETVHHKNGDKLDNRIENLELWRSGHPAGQRVEDKVCWCIDFLRDYGYIVIKT